MCSTPPGVRQLDPVEGTPPFDIKAAIARNRARSERFVELRTSASSADWVQLGQKVHEYSREKGLGAPPTLITEHKEQIESLQRVAAQQLEQLRAQVTPYTCSRFLTIECWSEVGPAWGSSYGVWGCGVWERSMRVRSSKPRETGSRCVCGDRDEGVGRGVPFLHMTCALHVHGVGGAVTATGGISGPYRFGDGDTGGQERRSDGSGCGSSDGG